MKSKKICFSWTEYEDKSELEPADRDLLSSAEKASENAYAPYSGFFVGAALRLENGAVITGSNVENAAFPSGICAERNVLSTASSAYAGIGPVSLAIAARNVKGPVSEPVTPCGNCRQVIAEEEHRYGKNIRIILGGNPVIRIVESAGDLLPLQFSMDHLRIVP